MKTAALVLSLTALCANAAALAQDDAPATQWRAVSRFGYGPQPTDDLRGDGQAWALRQLAAAQAQSRQGARVPEALAGFDGPLPGLFTRWRSEREARRQGDAEAGRAFSRETTRQAVAWRLTACSRADVENPLLARLTEFWFNHLNVFAGKAIVRPFVGHYAVHAIRPNVLGRYEDLLLASARHPAMLLYLDQAQSVAEGSAVPRFEAQRPRGLNENYARELLELHTLGVHGGYTQDDVRTLARMLTGWTLDPASDTGFRFAARLHDDAPKVFLGQSVPARGIDEGEYAIRLLARHPATAQRIGLRLAQWFVADAPPPALVQRLAARYLATQGDLAEVLRTLIESPETWAPQARLFKTPMDYACSVLAASGGAHDERALVLAAGFLASAGQPVHGWQTPDGYPTDAATWLSPEALSRRADFAMAIGRRLDDAGGLPLWLREATRARIAQEPAALQAGLALAAPEFMHK